MFSIYDGRDKFYQWDKDRKLIVYDETITEVHFANCLCSKAIPCEVKDLYNIRIVDVPDNLLTEYMDIRAWGYDSGMTKHEQVFEIERRPKPEDYVYTPEEKKTWEELEERVSELEENGGGSNRLLVTVREDFENDGYKTTHSSEFIYEHFKNGGEVIIYDEDDGLEYIPEAINRYEVIYTNIDVERNCLKQKIISDKNVEYKWTTLIDTNTFDDLDERVKTLEENGGSGTTSIPRLIVDVTEDEEGNYISSHTSQEIYDYWQNGGEVAVNFDYTDKFIPIRFDSAGIYFYRFNNDIFSTMEEIKIWFDGQKDSVKYTAFKYAQKSDITALEKNVGDIETALDSIIAIQEELIGGNS